jgi:hypothetical protein
MKLIKGQRWQWRSDVTHTNFIVEVIDPNLLCRIVQIMSDTNNFKIGDEKPWFPYSGSKYWIYLEGQDNPET